MIPVGYQHALDSGVYIQGVDTSDPTLKTLVDPARLAMAPVLLVLGQSNAANHGETRKLASHSVLNFNFFDGRCYRAADPLLGATGDGGSPWCTLGDALIEAGYADTIVFTPLAVGGATVAYWAPGGPFNYRLVYALGRLREAGLWPTHVLWHQGEADALHGTAAAAYVESFKAVVTSVRKNGVFAPIFVARASYFSEPTGYDAAQAVIRDAQACVLNPSEGIFAGPDTDSILDRFDGCHMGTAGLREHASAWARVLLAAAV